MHDNRKQRVASKNLQAKKRVKQLQVFDQPTRRVLWSRGSPKTIETPVVEEPATIAWESKARKRLFSPGPSFGTMESFLDLAVTIAWESKARKRLFSPGPSFGSMESFLDLAVTIAWESKARKRLFSPGPSFGTMESFLDLAVSIERLYPEKERIEAENRKLKQKVTNDVDDVKIISSDQELSSLGIISLKIVDVPDDTKLRLKCLVKGQLFEILFRSLNKKTIRGSYSLPRIDKTIDCLAGAMYFTRLDLRSAYWHMNIEEYEKQNIAFSKSHLGF
ncbi:Hypothetical predicted protein [Mytilus galloprovincialis]|uniref:Reverse transcriptase domain-containing protein n=1 Tax=Mytilus galloprovincialis TaxID=29158 RepID=A0A8B6BQ44_MYTGA|nr:Hypothetical predicted protein [Mytilus galloprovincialis]